VSLISIVVGLVSGFSESPVGEVVTHCGPGVIPKLDLTSIIGIGWGCGESKSGKIFLEIGSVESIDDELSVRGDSIEVSGSRLFFSSNYVNSS
jgi:hypothetical protein